MTFTSLLPFVPTFISLPQSPSAKHKEYKAKAAEYEEEMRQAGDDPAHAFMHETAEVGTLGRGGEVCGVGRRLTKNML